MQQHVQRHQPRDDDSQPPEQNFAHDDACEEERLRLEQPQQNKARSAEAEGQCRHQQRNADGRQDKERRAPTPGHGQHCQNKFRGAQRQ
jgi:hypothetical protein